MGVIEEGAVVVHPLCHPAVVERVTKLEHELELARFQAKLNGDTATEQAKELYRLRTLCENTVVEVAPWNKNTAGIESVTIWTLIEEPEVYGRPRCQERFHDLSCEGHD